MQSTRFNDLAQEWDPMFTGVFLVRAPGAQDKAAAFFWAGLGLAAGVGRQRRGSWAPSV